MESNMDCIHECMRKPIITLDEGASAQAAAQLMSEKKLALSSSNLGTTIQES